MKHVLSSSELLVSNTCAVLCDVIYGQEREPEGALSEIKSILGASPENFEYLSISDISTEAYVIQIGGRVYLVFRGSESDRDWGYNVNFELSSWHLGGHCHSGFLEVVRASSKTLLPILEKMFKKERLELVVTGHSLGGAMAQLYCALISSELSSVSISHLVTFGQPRVGNKKFYDWFSSLGIDHLRFVNEGDAVTDTPPPFGKHDWFHSGVPVLFDSNGLQVNASMDSEFEIWRRLLVYFIEFFGWRKRGAGVEYVNLRKERHGMGLYRKHIFNLTPLQAEELKAELPKYVGDVL